MGAQRFQFKYSQSKFWLILWLILFFPIGIVLLVIVNFPPKQIGKFFSEVLTLGLPDPSGQVVLVQPTVEVPKGSRLF